MDFEQVLSTLLAEFDHHQIRYAAIGGFAIGVLGVVRATVDLDFLVHRDDLEQTEQIVRRLGYVRFQQNENATQYVHQQPQWGAIDFLHAFRPASLGMLDRAKVVPVLQGSHTIRVVQPEDLIGFKVQAIANNPKRRGKDMDDIEQLMLRYKGRLDWARVEEYFRLFEMEEEARQLRQRIEHAQ